MDDNYLFLEKLGPLPDQSEEIGDGILERYEELFKSLEPPKDIDEAKILMRLFPKTSWKSLNLVHRTNGG